MQTKSMIETWKTLLALLAVASAACEAPSRVGSTANDDVGVVRFDLTNAPINARCAVITVTPETGAAVVEQIPLSPEQPAVFNFTGLPVGMVVATEQVFTVPCPVPATQAPTWAAAPVPLTLTAGMPVDVTFALALVAPGGELNARSNFPTPPNQITIFNAGTFNNAIAVGSDDNLWVTDVGQNIIVRVTPGGFVTNFPIPTPSALPEGIAAGPDGNLWFTEISGPHVARLNISNGDITEFPLPTGSAFPFGIVAGRDGRLWFTDAGNNAIGAMTTTGAVTEFAIPTANSSPNGIGVGADGNFWFTESNSNKIGRMSTNGNVAEFAVPTPNSDLSHITAGPDRDGNLWFTEISANRIGRVTPGGSIVEFTIPTANAAPLGIAAGPDGNVWFAEEENGALGRITPLGVVTEFPTPRSTPLAVTNGPDGNVWFTDFEAVGFIKP